MKDAFFIVEPNRAQLLEVAELIDAGRLSAHVKAVAPLGEAALAYSGSLKDASGPGKIVLSVAAGSFKSSLEPSRAT